jgi:hypothetical protein
MAANIQCIIFRGMLLNIVVYKRYPLDKTRMLVMILSYYQNWHVQMIENLIILLCLIRIPVD